MTTDSGASARAPRSLVRDFLAPNLVGAGALRLEPSNTRLVKATATQDKAGGTRVHRESSQAWGRGGQTPG